MKPRILIVEDDPFIALDLEDMLVANDYEVLGPVADVSSGLSVIEETAPDVAMLDYNLGEETSIPIAKALHAQDIPFLFLSGQISSVVSGHDLPDCKVISKPFNPTMLMASVNEIMAA